MTSADDDDFVGHPLQRRPVLADPRGMWNLVYRTRHRLRERIQRTLPF
ncbi:MAG: hypothetical protein R3F30_13965 [Planctomycetota bacterium]